MKVDTRDKGVKQADVEVKNQYLSILVAPDGRFNSGATGEVTGISYNISYYWPNSPWSSYTTVWIDGDTYIFGTGGEMIEAPNNYMDEQGRTINKCVWKYGDIYVTQYLEIVFNPYDNRNDNGAYIYTVYNSGAVSHEVGLRVMIDTMVNGNDGIPFSTTDQVGLITKEKEYYNIDNYFDKFSWYTLYSFNTPQIGSQGDVLNSNYYGIEEYVTPLPDRFVFCSWGNIDGSIWEYAINPNRSIVGDSAIAYWWNPRNVEPEDGFNCVSHMGLNSLDVEGNLGLSMPEKLELVGDKWNPNPFTAYLVVLNSGDEPLTDVEITLTVEAPGLRIYGEPVQTYSKLIVFPSIGVGETGFAAVSIEALQYGLWEVSASGLGQSITRTVEVPRQLVDLRITKTSTEESVKVGDEIEYKIIVNNLSTTEAENVRVVDNLPSNVEFVSATSSQGMVIRLGQVIDWSIGNILGAMQASATIKVKVIKIGTSINQATVIADNIKPDQINNNAVASNKIVGSLSTGPVVKDRAAQSLLVSINNTTDASVTIDIVLRATPCCMENQRVLPVTIPANCIKSYILGCIPSVYEVIFNNVEEGIYIWTATRCEDVCAPGKCSHLICANRFVHSELIEL